MLKCMYCGQPVNVQQNMGITTASADPAIQGPADPWGSLTMP